MKLFIKVLRQIGAQLRERPFPTMQQLQSVRVHSYIENAAKIGKLYNYCVDGGI